MDTYNWGLLLHFTLINEFLKHIWFGAFLQSLSVPSFKLAFRACRALYRAHRSLLASACKWRACLGAGSLFRSHWRHWQSFHWLQQYWSETSLLCLLLTSTVLLMDEMYGQEQNTESSQVLPFFLMAEIGCQNKFNRETSNFNLKALICSSAKKCNYLSIEVGLNLRGVEGWFS